MTRWTLLAIAFAVAACGEGDRDQLSREASDAGADSALRTDPDTTEMAAAGDRDVEGGIRADTDAEGRMSTDTAPTPGAVAGRSGGVTGARAMGGDPTAPAATTATMRLDLSADQVRRLQSALNDARCDAGTVDGVVGRRTRQAITCGLERNNLGSNDLNGLYRALDLDF